MITPDDEDTLSERPLVGVGNLQVVDSHPASTVGLVRAANEDHFGSTEGVFVVADGMGGAAGGAMASQLTVEHLLASTPADGWIAALSQVNETVRSECHGAGFPSAGSTVVGLVIERQRCVTLAMGDSRIFRFRDGGLHQLTADHNLGNLRREEGLDPSLADERGKPRALTSYVGNPDDLQRIDVGTVSAEDGDRMLLTTDGVHEQVPTALMAELIARPTCKEAAEALIDAADEAGGRDNATAFVIELGRASSNGAPSTEGDGDE